MCGGWTLNSKTNLQQMQYLPEVNYNIDNQFQHGNFVTQMKGWIYKEFKLTKLCQTSVKEKSKTNSPNLHKIYVFLLKFYQIGHPNSCIVTICTRRNLQVRFLEDAMFQTHIAPIQPKSHRLFTIQGKSAVALTSQTTNSKVLQTSTPQHIT